MKYSYTIKPFKYKLNHPNTYMIESNDYISMFVIKIDVENIKVIKNYYFYIETLCSNIYNSPEKYMEKEMGNSRFDYCCYKEFYDIFINYLNYKFSTIRFISNKYSICIEIIISEMNPTIISKIDEIVNRIVNILIKYNEIQFCY